MPQPESLRIVTEEKLELFINTQAASPVATIAELPAANSGNMGLIRFVTSENEPYYSNGTTWSSIAQGAQGDPGPAGAGVPAGGSALQIVRKNSVGTTTEWATPTKSMVGLANVDNTADMDKPISSPTEQALNLKASTSDLTAGLAGKADLQSGKVPVAQLPTDALVTDTNVAAQINGAQTGPAIDARINTQVTPVVEQITADYIASQPAVVDAAAAAVDANPKISTMESAITDAQHYMGALPLNTNLIDLPAKVSTYAVASSTAAGQIIPALPSGFADRGALEVLHSSSAGGGYRLFRFTTIGGSNRGVHEVELQDGVFTSWRRTDHHEVSAGGGVRTVPNGTNIDTLVRSGGEFDGEWITFTDIATSGITGTPAGETGLFHLRVSGGTGFQMIQFYRGGLYWRCINDAAASTFGPWIRLDKAATSGARTVPNGTNIDTLIRSGGEFDGEWITFTDAVTANITGLPEGETSLFHLRVSGGTGFQEIQFYKGGLYWRPVINAATSGFGAWVRLDQSSGTAPTAEEVSAERTVRTSRAKQRVGGKIGTSGLPAFALRFDDWADDLNTTVMPELDSRNLPAGWAGTVAYVENPSQGNSFTWAGVADWVRRGMEIMGHSWSHVNASGVANIRHEIIDSAEYIETQVPAAAIDTWTMPGTSAGANTYDGFGIGDKLANFYSTPAGRFILQRYPVVGGAITGRFLPLVGEPSIGRVHLTIDTLDAPTVIAEMVKARDAGVGYQLMCHPIHIGKADKITVADFRLVLDWLATERDAGRIEVLTPRGLAFADKSSNEWLSLVPGVDQWTGWNNRTGWTESGGVLTTTTGGVMVRGINMINYGNFRGGIVEIVARVRTPAGAVVQTGITGGAERIVDHTLPASTDWKWVRTVATIPNNLADSASLVASIGRVSGGQVDIDFMAVRPV